MIPAQIFSTKLSAFGGGDSFSTGSAEASSARSVAVSLRCLRISLGWQQEDGTCCRLQRAPRSSCPGSATKAPSPHVDSCGGLLLVVQPANPRGVAHGRCKFHEAHGILSKPDRIRSLLLNQTDEHLLHPLGELLARPAAVLVEAGIAGVDFSK